MAHASVLGWRELVLQRRGSCSEALMFWLLQQIQLFLPRSWKSEPLSGLPREGGGSPPLAAPRRAARAMRGAGCRGHLAPGDACDGDGNVAPRHFLRAESRSGERGPSPRLRAEGPLPKARAGRSGCRTRELGQERHQVLAGQTGQVGLCGQLKPPQNPGDRLLELRPPRDRSAVAGPWVGAFLCGVSGSPGEI